MLMGGGTPVGGVGAPIPAPVVALRAAISASLPGHLDALLHRGGGDARGHAQLCLPLGECPSPLSTGGDDGGGTQIHPGAQLGGGIFIDHAAGVIIGETVVTGSRIVMYQGVTLGGLSVSFLLSVCVFSFVCLCPFFCLSVSFLLSV